MQVVIGRISIGPNMRSIDLTMNARLFPKLSLFEKIQLRIFASLIRRLLACFPDNPVILGKLGHIELLLGEFALAEQTYGTSLAAAPRQPFNQYWRGVALENLGNYREALRCYRQATAIRADFNEAIAGRKRLVLNTSAASFSVEIYLEEGAAHLEAKHLDDALACFDHAVALRPDNAFIHNDRGATLHALGRLNEALECFDRAISLDDTISLSYRNKGACLYRLGRFTESVENTRRAIELQPDDPFALTNRACALLALNKIDDALADIEGALQIDPEYVDAIFNKSLCKLTNGEFEQGFRLYEWRIKKWGFNPEDQFGQPFGIEDVSVEGKTVLVVREQGYGDCIQFSRYILILEKRGARVIVEAPKPLCALFRTLSDTVVVVEQGTQLPAFDFVIPVASLGLECHTRGETMRSLVPYLYADPDKRRVWNDRLGRKSALRVGLAWSGGYRPDFPELWGANERRNIPLALLAPLALKGVEFYSLQLGEDARMQLRELESASWCGPKIIDHTDAIDDFADTAALIDNLDLVISVDTAVVHVAGALGKPVWVLNRFDTDWRWMLGRDDSPWYPTARLFRQQEPGNWTGAVAEVRQQLENILA
jgi:tetratricopeptide (TPR) repeat protein